ncbi:TSC22 domain family protein 4-like [Eucyclogobius newberryi]|uniref:TSC22 domain family protein 4-like n=1 Tax=Eucyclogobius newberryi TaxID=166745 RepID=UPI003B58BE1B
MSTMPAKKKSCFQITSVTQAQVTGNGTVQEPDEAQAEDGSSEVFDVSRTDPECERCTPEEAPNHAGEHQGGPIQVNGIPTVKGVGTGGRSTPVNLGGSVPMPTPTSQPSSVTSCSSRFRVIKLDIGSGEPFRRGRWTCTEFFEKESESNRTVDGVKPAVTHEHNTDRDGGLGLISNSVGAHSSFSVQSVENSNGGHPRVPIPSSELLQQGYTLAPQIGSAASALQPTAYSTTTAHVTGQPAVSQTYIPNFLNGVHQAPVWSPVTPPATQPQQLIYSNTGLFVPPEYHLQAVGSRTQSVHATSLPMMPPIGQGLSPLSPPGPGGQGLLAQGAEAALALVMSSIGETSGATGLTAASPGTVQSHSRVSSFSAAPGGASVSGDPRSTVSLFGITIPMYADDDSASGASVVAIDNKIEQAMDLVKNHLMYAVREEVEVLKEQIKELYEKNSALERENAVLKSLANSEQLNQVNSIALPQLHRRSSNGNALVHYEAVTSAPHQPNITSA